MPRSPRIQAEMAARRLRILQWLAGQAEGVALAKVSECLRRPKEELRRDLQQLCDEQLVRRWHITERREGLGSTRNMRLVMLRITQKGLARAAGVEEVANELGR